MVCYKIIIVILEQVLFTKQLVLRCKYMTQVRCIHQTAVERLEVKPSGKLRLWGSDVELDVSEVIWIIFTTVSLVFKNCV
jgi:hypothetical protein